MKNKAAPLLLAVLLVLSLAGCANRTAGSTTTTVGGGNSNSSSTPSATDRPEETRVPDGLDTDDADGNNGDGVGGTINSYDNADDADGMELGGLGGLMGFRDTLRGTYGDKYYPDTELTEEQMREALDLDESLYEEIYGENTAQKAHPDTFIVVKVKNGKTEEVKKKMEAYRQTLLDDNDYAANGDKIREARIFDEGEYVFFILLGDVDDTESSIDMGEAFRDEVQRGVDAIRGSVGAA